MRQKPWTAAEHRLLRRLYPVQDTATIVIGGRSRAAICSRAKVLRLRKKKQRKHWTPADDRQLRRLFPNQPTATVAAKLHSSYSAVSQHAKKLGLEKSAAYMAEMMAKCGVGATKAGVPTRFKKGLVPHNKGVRMPGFCRGRMQESWFRKGECSGAALAHDMPLWSFRWVDGYLMLKTGKRHAPPNDRWEYVHKLIWEQAHGPLPDWRVARIWWKDADHGNCSLSNLELIGAHEHMMRTSVHNLPKPLKTVIQLRGALNRKLRRLAHGEEHFEGPAGSSVRDAGGSAGATGQAG